MEIIWLVLLIMVPLFAGGLFALHRQNRTGTAKAKSTLPRTGAGAGEGRRRLPHGLGPMGVVLGAALIGAVIAALLLGFPLLRSLLIAFNAPVEAE